MSVESMSWALNLPDPTLTPTDRLTLVGICNHDGDGGAWPSVATLARYTGTTPRTVQRSIGRLIEAGYITRHTQQGGTARTPDGMRPNLYVVHRGDTHVTPPPDTSVTPPLTPMSPEPSSNHPLEPNKHTGDMVTSEPDLSFESFWDQYPRKEGKHTARGRWDKMSHEDRAAVFEALDDWCAYYATIDPKFIPHGSTWLNQRRWEDDPPDTPEPPTLSVVPSVGCDECDGTGWVEVDDPTLRAGRGMTKCECQRVP